MKQETETNAQRSWTVRFLTTGTCRFIASAPGFKTSERGATVLQTADMKQVNFALEIGQISERLTAVAEAPRIDITSAVWGTVVEPQAVTEIPAMSRIEFQLPAMSPGVQQVDQNNNVAKMWSKNAASAIRVNGGRDDRSNEFLLNGMPNQNRDKVAFISPVGAVAEFRIPPHAYEPSMGGVRAER